MRTTTTASLCTAVTIGILALINPAHAEDAATDVTTSYGLALYGGLKYGPDFRHFDYVNPEAPKGGTFRFSFAATYDNLNPFIVAGTAPRQNLEFLIYDTLMKRSGDEPSSVYGLVAESVTYANDFSWAEFRLRDEARWHDGEPITPGDVIFSLNLMQNKAAPQYRAAYAGISGAEKTGPHRLRFHFVAGSDRGTLYAASQLPIFPAHYWADRDFTKPSIEQPLSSGPYRVAKVDPGRSISYERVKDYWAKNLPVNVGLNNFDTIRHDYYRDSTINFEAFLAGNVDLRWETLANQWVTGYDIPAVKEGRLIKEMLPYSGTTMYAAYFFNLRKPEFQDIAVREAIASAFDFDWTNRMILYGQYDRLQSYFENSELAAHGLPSPRELALLEPYRDQLPPELFTQPFHSPQTDGTRASLRENLRKAVQLLQKSGWSIRDGNLVSPAGKPLAIEIIGFNPFFERVTGPFIANLELLGIQARQRTIDTAQWFRRMANFEFDLAIAFYFPQSMSPGGEQRGFWGSQAADQRGTQNYAGIKNPVVDAMIDKIINAPDRPSKVAATRALDRVLLWNYYTIPQYYAPGIPIAYWDKFGRPDKEPTWLQIIWHMSNWWVDPDKEAALRRWREGGGG
jgi:microcin C transport system substrate-binding protein